MIIVWFGTAMEFIIGGQLLVFCCTDDNDVSLRLLLLRVMVVVVGWCY